MLGVIKFRFPNKHDVYMHDTPTKNLFNADVRAFSHGCMRVRNPQRLAELLLAEDQGWPALASPRPHGGPQNNQTQPRPQVPVHITYFTAAVDDAGKLKQFSDIYGHEQRIALGMEGKAHLVAHLVKEKGARPGRGDRQPRRDARRRPGGKKDWVHQAFVLEIIDDLFTDNGGGCVARLEQSWLAPMLPHSRHLMRFSIRGFKGWLRTAAATAPSQAVGRSGQGRGTGPQCSRPAR